MLDNHLATTCDFSMIPCPNKCSDELFGKTLQVARKDLERHLNEDCPNREYKCALCGKKDKYYEMKWFHHKTCPKTITPCPNGCAVEMERQHTKEHVATECELTPVHCKYRRLGCSVILKRGDMAAHEEDDKLHLCMAIDKTASLEKGLERAFNRISTLEVIASELGAKQQKAASNIATLQRDYSAIGDDLASELNKLFLDLQRDAKSVTIKMTGYDSKRLNSTRFVSPSFNCTSESQGYNVLITVNPNGLGQGAGTHVAVHLWLREGENDSILDWPFTGDVTFTLLNQLEDRNHFSKTFSVRTEQNLLIGNAIGYNAFIPHSELGHDPDMNVQYLKDDTLYFRVLVNATDQKPWLEYTLTSD